MRDTVIKPARPEHDACEPNLPRGVDSIRPKQAESSRAKFVLSENETDKRNESPNLGRERLGRRRPITPDILGVSGVAQINKSEVKCRPID